MDVIEIARRSLEQLRTPKTHLLDPQRPPKRPYARSPHAVVIGAGFGGLAAAVRLEEAVAGARRVVIPDVAHMVGMEVPETLAGLIVGHVRPLGTWG